MRGGATHKSSDGVDDADEGEHEEREDQRDDERPPGKLGVAGVCAQSALVRSTFVRNDCGLDSQHVAMAQAKDPAITAP